MRVLNKFLKRDKNDIAVSVVLNMLMKPISMVITLMYTPLLLNYLGDEKYGVWVTILSIINWITTFDVGLGNGLRNTLTAELLQGKNDDAKKSVSTAYVGLGTLVIGIFIVGIILIQMLNWNSILNTKIDIVPTLIISFSFICINFVLTIQNNCYYAIQKAEIVSIIGILVQLINLLGVFVFSKISSINSSIINMAVLTGISGFIIYFFFSIRLWSKFQWSKPSLKEFCCCKLKQICSVGIKFFFLQISALILFTTDSLLISNLYSPSEVTPYNTVYKVFGIVHGVFSAMLVPMWSRYTVAKEENDYIWMKKTLKKMKLLWIVFSVLLVILVPIYPFVSNIWLGKELNYEKGLVIIMAIYYIAFMYSGMYSTILNGVGAVNVQLVCAIASAVVNIPLSIFFAKTCALGTTGICIGTIIGLLIGNIVFSIQVKYILKKGLKI